MLKGDKVYIRKLLSISKLAFTLLLLSMIVRTSVLLWRTCGALPSAQPQTKADVQVGKTAIPHVLPTVDYSEIIEKKPFGLLGLQSVGNDTLLINSTVSEQLGLTLFGTVSGNPALARAIIKNLKTGTVGLYKMGQTIADAHIDNIYSDSVILMHNGEKKTLTLSTTPGNNYADRTAATNFSESKRQASNTATVGLSKTANNNNTRTAIQPLEAVLGKALIVPYTINGQVEGLKIANLENIMVAKDIDLKDGDIIRSVNGHKTTDKQRAFQTFKKARTQESINLDLMRDGETKKLSFAMR